MSLEVVLNEPLGLPIGFPLVPFLNGIVFYYRYRKRLINFKVCKRNNYLLKNLLRAAFFKGLTDKYPETILYTILTINKPSDNSTIISIKI